MTAAERARRYLAKLPPAVAGQRGHDATFAAACRLVEFGLPFEAAFDLLSQWNETSCLPPWSERELRHKLADAFRKARPRPEFVGSDCAPPGRAGRPCEPFSKAAPGPHRAGQGDFPPSGPDRAEKLRAHLAYRAFSSRARYGDMGETENAGCAGALARIRPRLGTDAELRRLAALRGLSPEAVALAQARGLLRFGAYRNRPAWFVLDRTGRAAQARRLDGREWFPRVKSLNLPGTQATWPLGIREAAPFRTVALVEGGPDLLAACHFLLREQRPAECAPVAMLGACPPIHPEALPLFAGKRVRIFGHADPAGARAVARWSAQLAAAGAQVDAFSLVGLRRADGQPVKDLNDLAAVAPEIFGPIFP